MNPVGNAARSRGGVWYTLCKSEPRVEGSQGANPASTTTKRSGSGRRVVGARSGSGPDATSQLRGQSIGPSTSPSRNRGGGGVWVANDDVGEDRLRLLHSALFRAQHTAGQGRQGAATGGGQAQVLDGPAGSGNPSWRSPATEWPAWMTRWSTRSETSLARAGVSTEQSLFRALELED